MSQTITAPEGCAFVPMLMARGGEPTAHALIDLADAHYLERLGISSPWFFSRTTGRVLGRNAEGKEVPIARMLARPPRHLDVGYRDGDPTNLTRANLVVDVEVPNV